MPRAGQTKPAVAPRLPDRIAIGVLTQTFPPELVDRVIVNSGRAEQRQRLLPARVVLYYTLAMCLFTQVGYEEVMRLLVEGLTWARRWRGSWQIPDKSSIARARHGWGRRRCGSCLSRSPGRWRPARRRGRGIAAGGWWRWTAPPWTCRTRPPTWRRSAGPVGAAGRERSRRSAWWGWWSAAPTRSWTRPWAGCTWARVAGTLAGSLAGTGDAAAGRPGPVRPGAVAHLPGNGDGAGVALPPGRQAGGAGGLRGWLLAQRAGPEPAQAQAGGGAGGGLPAGRSWPPGRSGGLPAHHHHPGPRAGSGGRAAGAVSPAVGAGDRAGRAQDPPTRPRGGAAQ